MVDDGCVIDARLVRANHRNPTQKYAEKQMTVGP